MIQKALHRIRPRPCLDNIFLFYSLLLLGKSSGFDALLTGSTINHLPRERLAKVGIVIPPLPIQRRIASILGAYDDLIKVNRRRIAVLEEMARRLFDEWFVHFRFPGHENHKMVMTEHGALPEEWRWAPLEDMLVLQRGFDLPGTSREPGEFSLVTASGIHGTHSKSRVAAPGIVTGRSGTIGNVFLIYDDFWPLNTTLYVKEFKRAKPLYALHLLRNLDLKSRAVGAAVPTLNRNHIHGILVARPPAILVDRFERYAEAMLRDANLIQCSNDRLCASRDLLLPRLISGELSVESVEAELEAAE